MLEEMMQNYPMDIKDHSNQIPCRGNFNIVTAFSQVTNKNADKRNLFIIYDKIYFYCVHLLQIDSSVLNDLIPEHERVKSFIVL